MMQMFHKILTTYCTSYYGRLCYKFNQLTFIGVSINLKLMHSALKFYFLEYFFSHLHSPFIYLLVQWLIYLINAFPSVFCVLL